MFELHSEPLPGLKLIKPKTFEDVRGSFVKTFHKALWEKLGLTFALEEEFFSTSRASVIRGMHFQLPPHAHTKIVYCLSGKVNDVVLDIRKSSPSYGKSVGFELSDANRLIAVIPPGFAHGFASLTDGATMVYKTDAVYAPSHDAGIRWDSFGYAWGISAPVISDRDRSFPTFEAFATPF